MNAPVCILAMVVNASSLQNKSVGLCVGDWMRIEARCDIDSTHSDKSKKE